MKNATFKWALDRPLVIFDIEATGTNVRSDRIVDLSLIKLLPDGTRETHNFRVNPTIPIPPEATRIHGITDAEVAAAPTFRSLAPTIAALLDGCDLGGYNVIHFDIPMLAEEFFRAGVAFDWESRRVIDAQRVFHKREPRDLTAALAFYCGEMHLDAHGAEADALATVRVFEGEFERYKDLPRDIAALHEYCNPRDPSWVDRSGRLKWIGTDVALNFGKKKGALIKDVLRDDPGFIKWMLRGDFPRDTQEVLRNAMDGTWPPPPVKAEGSPGA